MCATKIKLTAGTNVGLVRTNNEDNFVVNKDLSQNDWFVPQEGEELSLGKYGCLLVVADGMGGTNAGEVASAIAIETMQKGFIPENLAEIIPNENEDPSEGVIKEFVTSLIKQADLNIVNKSNEDKATEGMGTTIVLAWLLKDKAYIAWCGDSRCYVFNAKSGICRLSKDHSFVQELVDAGKLDQENAFDHPYSNIITRCLGDPNQRSVPDFRTYDLTDGDILLLCSDGLCGLCKDEDIIDVINENMEDLSTCKDKLIEAALAAGGHDNVTVALCQTSLKDKENKLDIKNTLFGKPKKRNKNRLPIILLLIIVLIGIGIYNHSCLNKTNEGTQNSIDSLTMPKNDTLQINRLN